MIKDSAEVKGRLVCVLLDKDGKEKFRDAIPLPNGITDAGITALIRYAFNDSTAPTNRFRAIGIGTSNTAFAKAQTDLLGTAYRKAAASYLFTSPDKIRLMAEWGPNEPTGASFPFGIQEIGVFNETSGGTMLSRLVRAVLNKEAADTLQIYYEFDFNY